METEHAVPVAENQRVAAVHHDAGGDDWIVFCHGFLSDKSGSYQGRCREAVARGYDAVRFDFRGCGESDGDFADSTLSARIADLEAVIEYFDPASVVIFGSSFGGKVAFHAPVDDLRVEAVATRAPVTYAGTFDDRRAEVEADGAVTLDDGRTIDARFFEALDRYDFTDVESGLDCPVAIFHGVADGSVAVEDSFRAAKSLDVDVLLQTYVGEGHRFSREAEAQLRRQLFDWLDVFVFREGPQ